LIAKG